MIAKVRSKLCFCKGYPTAQACALLSGWRGPGALVVVTHQVNITALTGKDAASAEGMVVRLAVNEPPVGGRDDRT